MIWLTWRLQRLELLIMAAILALLSAYLISTGIGIHSVYDDFSSGCAIFDDSRVPCDQLQTAIYGRAASSLDLFTWLRLLPLGFAILAAAPLLLQVERGTYRLVWTQSATKERWLTIMVGAALLTTVVASVGFDLLTSWWRQPLDVVQGSWHNAFDFEGIVPIAYGVFALALILVAGVLLRRAFAAIGIAFAGFLVARYAITTWLRPSYLAPVRYAWQMGHPPKHPGMSVSDWEIAMGQGNRAGSITPQSIIDRTCPAKAASNGITNAVTPCLQHHHWTYNVFLFQPASRFWSFQIIESAIYLGMAAVLLGITVWWVQKRLV